MQKANEYKKQKGIGTITVEEAKPISVNHILLQGSTEQSFVRSSNKVNEDTDDKKQELKVSCIDFIWLGFADKRNTRGLPPGLVPVVDYLPDGDLPEVELLLVIKQDLCRQKRS